MKTRYQKINASIFSAILLLAPIFVYGQGLIPCDTDCTFEDLVVLANNIIHFLMYDIAVPLAALGFMYGGARLVLFQDKEGEWSKAKETFGNIALGFCIILGAYVLIKVVLFALLSNDQIEFMKFMFDVTPTP